MVLSDPGGQVEILLIEDNPGDVRLTLDALRETNVRHRVSVVRDGEEAMFFLRRRAGYAGVPRPGLILLDMNLPRKHGREVLSEIKSDPDLRRIPVVILTSSKAEEDVVRAYDLHANCYITKPVDWNGLVEALGAIDSYWLRLVKLPSR